MATKYILVLAATLFCSINVCLCNVPFSEEMAKNRDECLQENSLTHEEVRNSFKTGEMTDQVMCFRKCLMTKEGLFDESGAIQKDNLDSVLKFPHDNEEERQKIIECIKGLDVTVEKCEDVLKVTECFPKKGKH